MKTWLILVILAVVPAGTAAQDAKSGGAEKVAFKSASFEGEVVAENLNVRMFPKGNPDQSIITSVLHMGEKVSVVAEQGDYFQIRPPKGSTVWVSAKSLKKEGATASALANDVPVRLDSRVSADQVAALREGETVKVVAEHMGWFKIESPDSVKYFVGKKYVKASGVVPAVAAPKDEPRHAARVERRVEDQDSDSDARKEIAIAESLLDEQKRLIDARQMRQVDFTEAVRHFETARTIARTETVRGEADRGIKRYKMLSELWQETKAKMEAQEEAAAKAREELLRKPIDVQKSYVMTGYVDTTGLLWKRPGTHKLVMGGKIVCFLRVKDGDDRMIGRLNDCYQKYVGVSGTVIKNPDGWDGYSVVVVEEVAPVAEPAAQK
jgi:uncharacterized protein YgiM (DUF1202 family)